MRPQFYYRPHIFFMKFGIMSSHICKIAFIPAYESIYTGTDQCYKNISLIISFQRPAQSTCPAVQTRTQIVLAGSGSSQLQHKNISNIGRQRKHIPHLLRQLKSNTHQLKVFMLNLNNLHVIFYWKVIFPSITYCIVVWGNCSKTHFKALGRLHTRATGIIYRLNWDIPSQEVMHKTGWKTLSTYKQRVLSTLHKCCYGEVPDNSVRI